MRQTNKRRKKFIELHRTNAISSNFVCPALSMRTGDTRYTKQWAQPTDAKCALRYQMDHQQHAFNTQYYIKRKNYCVKGLTEEKCRKIVCLVFDGIRTADGHLLLLFSIVFVSFSSSGFPLHFVNCIATVCRCVHFCLFKYFPFHLKRIITWAENRNVCSRKLRESIVCVDKYTQCHQFQLKLMDCRCNGCSEKVVIFVVGPFAFFRIVITFGWLSVRVFNYWTIFHNCMWHISISICLFLFIRSSDASYAAFFVMESAHS